MNKEVCIFNNGKRFVVRMSSLITGILIGIFDNSLDLLILTETSIDLIYEFPLYNYKKIETQTEVELFDRILLEKLSLY